MKKLPNFIPPRESKLTINKAKVQRFIIMFNKKIQKNEFTLNDGLDEGVEELNDAEFNLAQQQALTNDYNLTRFDDNNNTTTYKLDTRSDIYFIKYNWPI